MVLLFLLAVIATTCSAQTTQPTYQVTYTYLGSGCSGNVVFMRYQQATCTVGTGTCSNNFYRTDCVQGAPGLIVGGVGVSGYATDNTCSTTPSAGLSWASGICVQDGPNSYTVSCTTGNQLFVSWWSTNNVCLGFSQVYLFNVGCAGIGTQGFPANITGLDIKYTTISCNGLCFHESSKIELPSSKSVVTMDSLVRKEHPECHVPHQVQGAGVAITTTCGGDKLRLTTDHLVYTGRGMIAAAHVKVGDEVYGDHAESKKCAVTKVEVEHNQRYFGLNCKDSDVLANGIKTSTFGVTHGIPALWMKYASKVLGVERASAWGDAVATLLARANLI